MKQEKIEDAPKLVDPKEAQARKIEAQRIKENKIVRGIFRFHEVPGGNVTFPFRKFKKDGIKKYTFVDGQIYEIPLGVAKHLNKNGKYPVHSHSVDSSGKPSITIGKTVSRFSFDSLDFIDTSDSDSLATMAPPNLQL